MQLVHLSDIHLNFCKQDDDRGRKTRKYFIKSLNDAYSQNAKDIVLIGDISECPYLINDLYWLSQNYSGNIYFVLGNHDYYCGDFSLGGSLCYNC